MKSEGGFRRNDFQSLGGNKSLVTPTISIITVVYNNNDYLEKTILSVVNQTYKGIEYIVVDGGSTDGTMDVVRKYNDRIDYWLSEPDKGIYDAMNKGLKVATGTYVLFLNSGDLFSDSEVLKKTFNNFSTDKPDVYYGETNLIDSKGAILGTRTNLTTRKLPEKLTWKDMRHGMVVSHQSIIVKREIAAFYDLKYRFSADTDWVIECLKRSKVVVNTGLIISNYLVGGFSIKNQKQSWKERFTIYKKHYGLLITLFTHLQIIVRNIGFKLIGKKNF